jgi:hypothetical protein
MAMTLSWGVAEAQRPDGFDALHAGHDDVGDHQIRRRVAQRVQCGGPILRFGDGMSQPLQCSSQHDAKRLIVIN